MFGSTDNERSSRHHEQRFSRGDSLLGAGEEPPVASHLVSPRRFYTHHGIYVGNGRVIHYSGLAYGLRHGPVEDVSLERFGNGRRIRIRHDAVRFDRREVLERARSRLGESHYRVLTNNCEHFCAWVLRDESQSNQVERLRSIPRIIYGALFSQLQHIERHCRLIAQALRPAWDRSSLARTAYE